MDWLLLSLIALIRNLIWLADFVSGGITSRTNRKRRLTGTYTSLVKHPSGDSSKSIYNIVAIRSHGWFGFRANTIYTSHGKRQFKALLRRSRGYDNMYLGEWDNSEISEYFGVFMFRTTSDGMNAFFGRYAGPDRTMSDIFSGEWNLVRTSNKIFNKRFVRNLDRSGLVDDVTLLDAIISRHEMYFGSHKDAFSYEFHDKSYTFDIPDDGFNPAFGKISRRLLEVFFSQEGNGIEKKSVLDVGTGCGFYATICAAAGCRESVGVDISEKTISSARQNCNRSLGRAENVSFFASSDPRDPFLAFGTPRKFDRIIANMPFTNEGCGKPHKENPLYYNFVTSKETLLKLLSGAKFFLADEGVMYMSFGASGYWETLRRGCEIFGLTLEEVEEFKEPHETFHVLKIQHTS